MIASAALLAWAFAAPVIAGPDLSRPVVLNAGFSEDENADGLPDKWEPAGYRGGPKWKIDESAGPDGSACVRIDCPTGEDIGLLKQNIRTRTGGQTYRLTVQLRATPGTRATVSCTSYSENEKWLRADLGLIVASEEESWVTRGAYFKHHAEGRTIEIGLWCNFQGGEPGSVWFDNVKLEPVAEIPPTRYQPEHPEPTPSAEETTRGFLLFERHYLSLMCQDYNPAPEERLERLNAFASQGEYEPVSFGVYAFRDLDTLRVEVSDLLSDSGKTLPAANIDIRSVRHLPKRSHYSRRDRLTVPTFLEAKLLRLKAQTAGQSWLTVHVPDEAEGGVYRGEVTVLSDTGRATVPLEFRVFPFRLREPRDKWFGLYDGLGLPGQSMPLAERYADMRRHGLTTVGFVGPLGGTLRLESGKTHSELEGCALGRVATTYKAAGFPAPLVWVMTGDVRDYALRSADGDLESEAFADAYRAAVKQLLRHGRLNEWPELVFRPEDDVFSNAVRLARCARQLALLKEVGATAQLAGANEAPERSQAAADLAAMLVLTHGPVEYRKRVYPGRVWRALMQGWRADDKQIVFANFDTTGYHPESMRFGNGFLVAATGADGMLNSAYSLARDPYGERTGVAGDVQFHYPKTTEEEGGPSIGYEGLREGIDDYKYWYTLSAWVEEGKGSAETRAAARALLGGLFEDLDLSRLRTNMSLQGEWEYSGSDERGDDVRRGAFKLPIPWAFAEYDRRRLELAEVIEGLVVEGPR